MRGILFSLLLQTAILSTTVATQCYFSDGTETNSEMQPCFPDKSVSACCSTNKEDGLANDVCLQNGLCMAQVAQYSGMIFQNACTKKTWDSSDCPKVCGMSMAQNTGIYVLPCPQRGVGYWCCSANGTECCDEAFRMNMGNLVMSTDSSTTSSATGIETVTANATAMTTTTTTASVTVTATAEPHLCAAGGTECPKSNTTAVGAGLGISLGACLVGTVGALFFQRRSHQKKLREYHVLHASQMVQFAHGGMATHPTSRAMAELPPRPDRIYEIGEGRRE